MKSVVCIVVALKSRLYSQETLAWLQTNLLNSACAVACLKHAGIILREETNALYVAVVPYLNLLVLGPGLECGYASESVNGQLLLTLVAVPCKESHVISLSMRILNSLDRVVVVELTRMLIVVARSCTRSVYSNFTWFHLQG